MKVDAEPVHRTSSRKFRLAAICFIIALLATYAVAQAGKRLILKDGTWQGITKYEVQGDRARYFSSQRGEWEELPKELVDWKATEEWNAGLKEKSPDLRQFEAEEDAERKDEGAKGITVAPGLKLPTMGGVFVLDTFSGQPSLDELAQNVSELNNDLRSAFNRKASIMERFELKGLHARVQAHVPAPEIFVKIAEDTHAQQIALSDRFHILRLEPKQDSRVLVSVKVSVLGKQSQSPQVVPARLEPFAEGWLKVVPLRALEAGEYALVEMLGQNEFNSYVWDFGVDPNAPDNPNSRKPDSPANDERD